MHVRGPDIYPPDPVLSEIGRVAIAAAGLEAAMAQLHVGLLGTPPYDTVTQWPAKRVRTNLRQAAATLPNPLGPRLLAWVDTTQDLADQRDRAVHAFAIISLDGQDADGWYRTSTFHPRTGTYQTLDAGTLNDLAIRIGTCTSQLFDLLQQIADHQARLPGDQSSPP